MLSVSQPLSEVKRCAICGREMAAEEGVHCVVCGAPMHRGCIDEEVLEDSEGNLLCPIDAALAALDWLDAVLSLYEDVLKRDKELRTTLVSRLKNYYLALNEEVGRGER